MRADRWLDIFVPVAVLGGAALAMLDASSVMALIESAPLRASAAISLLLLGATAGLLNLCMVRRHSRHLAAETAKALIPGKPRYVEPPENALAPLVVALNDGFAQADASVQAALNQVRELQIQLKVSNGQRKQAEAIIYSINDAVLVTDAFDEVLLANDSAAKVLGAELRSLDRKPLEAVTSDRQLVQLIRDIRLSRNTSERRVLEHRVRREGRESVYKVTLSCIGESGQEPTGVVAVLHDMTRENEIARMKNDFVSSVSHELRTPLASIRAYIEMLIDGEAADDKTRSDFYEIIQNEANRLGRLIDNILNISRIESGLVEIKKEPLSLMVLIKDALGVITPQARGKNISLEEQLDPAYYQIFGDRDMIYQSIMNLMSNAVKYTRDGGTVTVRTSVDEVAKKVTFRVIDTGVGIPPKDLPFVFDKFYRVEANKSVAKGTGLGLSLVKNMIETVHRGKVFAESEVGRGSSFGFTLDLHP